MKNKSLIKTYFSTCFYTKGSFPVQGEHVLLSGLEDDVRLRHQTHSRMFMCVHAVHIAQDRRLGRE